VLRPASKSMKANTIFFIFIFPFLRLRLHHVLRAAAALGYAHRARSVDGSLADDHRSGGR
jgi:hypothetical protein